MYKALWQDEGGAIISAELVLLLTILVVGLVVGLTALRTAIVTEMADVSASIASLNQSYSIGGLSGHHAVVAGSFFNDLVDTGDDPDVLVNEQCVVVCETVAAGEGEVGLP